MASKARELVKTERPTHYLSPFEEIERFFEKAWLSPFSMMRSMFPRDYMEFRTDLPSVDMYEEGNELVVKADLPGIRKEDLDVYLSGNILTVSGETKSEEKVEKGDYYRFERRKGSFSRRFELPYEVDTEKMKAHLENGVLEIRLSKAHEGESMTKQIRITG